MEGQLRSKHQVWGQHFGAGVTVRGGLCDVIWIKMRNQEEGGVESEEGSSRT